MLDIKRIMDDPEGIKTALSKRNADYDIDGVVKHEDSRKKIIQKVEALKAAKNKVSQQIAMKKRNGENADDLIRELQNDGDNIKKLDSKLAKTIDKLKKALLSIPNVPSETTPVGKDDSQNIEVRKWGQPRDFGFQPQAHWDLGEKLHILDFKTAGKITGARFTVYRGLGAKLERSIISYMLDTHTARGYTEILPPYMVNRDSMTGTGQLPKFEEDAFAVKNMDYFLIPTAEVPVTNMYRDDILDGSALPLKYCAYSACFRAEAGSAGRDTRGLIRQHQFNKVELVKFARPENSYEELETLTNDAEQILITLGLPYRVMALSTGDIGFSSAKTYDLEVWMPSYGRYVEISSCSNFEDYQARRANIKFRDANGKPQYVHTLNGSGLAVGRTVAAIMENYQTQDGKIEVPEALRKYMGTDTIS